MFQNIAAHCPVDLSAVHGIAFIAAPGIHLEGACQSRHHGTGLGTNRRKVILFHFHGRAYAVYAKHLGHPTDAFFLVRIVTDEHPAVMEPYLALHRLHRIADFLHQFLHEIWAV